MIFSDQSAIFSMFSSIWCWRSSWMWVILNLFGPFLKPFKTLINLSTWQTFIVFNLFNKVLAFVAVFTSLTKNFKLTQCYFKTLSIFLMDDEYTIRQARRTMPTEWPEDDYSARMERGMSHHSSMWRLAYAHALFICHTFSPVISFIQAT